MSAAPSASSAGKRLIPRLISRRALFGDPPRRALLLSPDGQWVSFIAEYDGAPNIWLAPSDDIADARPLTRERGQGILSYRWAADSARLCYPKDKDGDENFHLFVLPIEAGPAIDLTPLDGVSARIVAGGRFRPTELLVGLNERDRRWHDLYRVNLLDGARELVLQHDRFITFCADRSLALRLCVSPTGDGGLDYMVPDGAGDWLRLLHVAEEDVLATGIAGLGPDDANFAYFIDSRGRDRAAAVTIDLTSGDATELAAAPDAEVVELLIDPVQRGLQAIRTMDLRSAWRVMDPGLEADFARLAEMGPGDLHILSRTADDRRWIVAHAGDVETGVYHLYDRESGEARRLFEARPALSGAALRPMKGLRIPARDGLQLPAYLTRAGDDDGPGPMVLLVHGGPWARDTWAFSPWQQWLADRGYAVLSINFRGSTGFGKAYINAGDREWGGRMQDDLRDGVDWAIRNGVADPQRIAIMGASYGGYATLAGLTFSPEVFACGVDLFGPSDLEALIANMPPYWQPLIALWRRRVGDIATEEGRAMLRERSPLYRAGQIRRPLLIAHGDNDVRISIAASETIAAATRKNGQPVVFMRYPDEGHSLARQENRLSFCAVAEAFLARYLGGRCEPFGSDLDGSSLVVEMGGDIIDSFAAAGEGRSGEGPSGGET